MCTERSLQLRQVKGNLGEEFFSWILGVEFGLSTPLRWEGSLGRINEFGKFYTIGYSI